MHFLCLHGVGTNVQIFQAQTAALRYELGNDHTYDFVEGELPCEPASGIGRIATQEPNVEYFSHFDWYSASSALDALSSLSAYMAVNGPYDGVMAFSQGSCLASTLMLQHHRSDPDDALPLFRCAIFFSGILPLDTDALQVGQRRQVGKLMASEEKYTDRSSDTESDDDAVEEIADAFAIPTAHIWGTNDDGPLPQGERLFELCPSALRVSVTHREGHAIPGRKDEVAFKKMVRAVRHTIQRAEMMH